MQLRNPSDVTKRELVGKLSTSDVKKALEVARSIAAPWYRCQSLAHVAWRLKDKSQYKKVTDEALAAAYEQTVANRIVSVAAWPVSAMVARNDPRSESVVDRLLHTIESEPNPVRQADALLLLFQAVYRNSNLREVVLNPLLRACHEMHSWKRPIILSDIALVLAIDEPDRAAEVVAMIGEGRKSRQTKRQILDGKWLGPREFFP